MSESEMLGKLRAEYVSALASGNKHAIRDALFKLAEYYECADCGHESYGSWNCQQCGRYNLIKAY